MSYLIQPYSYPRDEPTVLPKPKENDGGAAELPRVDNEVAAEDPNKKPRADGGTPTSSALMLLEGRGSATSAII
jgi:hypothetical protein